MNDEEEQHTQEDQIRVLRRKRQEEKEMEKRALQEFDPEKRNELLAEATRIAFAQTPIVPLYWQKVFWGAREGITINGGLSEYTLAQDVKKTD